jgi:hypothetical protein
MIGERNLSAGGGFQVEPGEAEEYTLILRFMATFLGCWFTRTLRTR